MPRKESRAAHRQPPPVSATRASGAVRSAVLGSPRSMALPERLGRLRGDLERLKARLLAQHFQTERPMDSRDLIEGQVRECYGRVVYSHKTHEKCADILLSRLSKIKLWQIILSSITTAGFIATFFGAGRVGAVIGVCISTTLLTLNAYTKNYDVGELAQKAPTGGRGLVAHP